jgi:hypothetical protein
MFKSTVSPNTTESASMDPTLSPPLVLLTNTIHTASKLGAGTSHIQPLKGSPHQGNNLYSSSRYERPPPSTPSLSSSSRFGSSAACPGCWKAVSPMEMGVVPGPQGSKWHATCLVCGGKGTGKGRRDKSQPGCGKRLDSAAKRDAQGGVWCRECLVSIEHFPSARDGNSRQLNQAPTSIAFKEPPSRIAIQTSHAIIYRSQRRERAFYCTSVDRYHHHCAPVHGTQRGRLGYLATTDRRGTESNQTACWESDKTVGTRDTSS